MTPGVKSLLPYNFYRECASAGNPLIKLRWISFWGDPVELELYGPISTIYAGLNGVNDSMDTILAPFDLEKGLKMRRMPLGILFNDVISYKSNGFKVSPCIPSAVTHDLCVFSRKVDFGRAKASSP